MKRLQLLTKHFRSLCITIFFLGISTILLQNKSNRSSTKTVWMMIPLAITFIVSALYSIILKKKTYDGEPFIKLLKIVWDLAWVLLALTVSLKLDGLISWGWKTVFFPLWIAYAILITATLVTVSIMLTTLIPIFCCRRKDMSRVLTYIWINLHSLALCIILPMMIGAVSEAAEVSPSDKTSGKFQSLTNLMIAVCVYMIVLLLFTLIIITPITYCFFT